MNLNQNTPLWYFGKVGHKLMFVQFLYTIENEIDEHTLEESAVLACLDGDYLTMEFCDFLCAFVPVSALDRRILGIV